MVHMKSFEESMKITHHDLISSSNPYLVPAGSLPYTVPLSVNRSNVVSSIIQHTAVECVST